MSRAAVFALLGLLTAGLAGCGGSGGGSSSTAAPAPSAAAPATTAPTLETTTAAAPESTATPATTAAPASSASGGGAPALETVADGFDNPVLALSPPGDPRIFVVEQPGTIWIVRDGRKVATPFLDLTGTVTKGGPGEQGLLGLAFAPDFATSGLIAVDYTDLDGNTHVVEYTATGDTVDPSTARELLEVDQPYPNHNGGNVVFGPDGRLWVGMGDGGSGGDPQDRAQNPDVLLGKLLRLDPADPDAKPEVWALGLRNPWRFSFDPKTKDLWIGDVGQGEIEEIDHVPSTLAPGANFGWRRLEGTKPFDGETPPADAIPPVAEYTHADGGCSVTGGVVARDGGPLDGLYIYGDYCSGKVWTLEADAAEPQPKEITDVIGQLDGLTSFGTDGDGHVLVVQQGGRISRVVGR